MGFTTTGGSGPGSYTNVSGRMLSQISCIFRQEQTKEKANGFAVDNTYRAIQSLGLHNHPNRAGHGVTFPQLTLDSKPRLANLIANVPGTCVSVCPSTGTRVYQRVSANIGEVSSSQG